MLFATHAELNEAAGDEGKRKLHSKPQQDYPIECHALLPEMTSECIVMRWNRRGAGRGRGGLDGEPL